MTLLTGANGLPRRSSPLVECAGLVAVVLLFCAPLFVGLDRWDLRSDEAIYSYAVDRIIETGEWLTPRSIEVDGPFLEKPPLKFWMVAGLMRAGLLPRDEFGFRFLDALFGAVAFIYVYYFGARLGGALCGLAATLILFTFDSLMFEHGLRSNNMEAPLFLCYCGGMYHLARWVEGDRRPRAHAAATCACFVLGFMTKFVAALFLPLAALLAIVWIPEARARIGVAWRTWVLPSRRRSSSISAWFIYETVTFGAYFWQVILGLHVFTRFTSSLDPTHLHPWYFYFDETWTELARSGSRAAAAAGIVVLFWTAWRGRPWQMRLLLLWWLVPYGLISIGTSKLLHYAYPFMPPIALAIGWVAAIVFAAVATGTGVGDRLRWLDVSSRSGRHAQRLRAAGMAIAAVAAGTGDRHRAARAGGVADRRCESLSELVGGTAGAVGRDRPRRRGPAGALRADARRVDPRLRAAGPGVSRQGRTGAELGSSIGSGCASASRAPAATANIPAGIYNAAQGHLHWGHYYYLNRLGAWTVAEHPEDGELQRRLFSAGEQSSGPDDDAGLCRGRNPIPAAGAAAAVRSHRG